MKLQEITERYAQNRVLQRKLHQLRRRIAHLEAENQWLREMLAKTIETEDKQVIHALQR